MLEGGLELFNEELRRGGEFRIHFSPYFFPDLKSSSFSKNAIQATGKLLQEITTALVLDKIRSYL